MSPYTQTTRNRKSVLTDRKEGPANSRRRAVKPDMKRCAQLWTRKGLHGALQNNTFSAQTETTRNLGNFLAFCQPSFSNIHIYIYNYTYTVHRIELNDKFRLLIKYNTICLLQYELLLRNTIRYDVLFIHRLGFLLVDLLRAGEGNHGIGLGPCFHRGPVQFRL